MGSFLELFEELTKVSREALNCDSSIPGDGKIEDICFSFGPPRRGRLSFYIIRNGRKYLLGNLCDCYPVFPTLRGWMERAVTPTFIGRRRNEGITIECEDGVIELALSPIDLEMDMHASGSDVYCIVGILRIRHIGHTSTTHECLCDVERTVCSLYFALRTTLRRHRERFDRRYDWIIYEREGIYGNGRSASQILLDQLHSEKIEITSQARRLRKVR